MSLPSTEALVPWQAPYQAKVFPGLREALLGLLDYSSDLLRSEDVKSQSGNLSPLGDQGSNRGQDGKDIDIADIKAYKKKVHGIEVFISPSRVRKWQSDDEPPPTPTIDKEMRDDADDTPPKHIVGLSPHGDYHDQSQAISLEKPLGCSEAVIRKSVVD
ncbi:hypothetical protein Pfo_019006, partial [Paulownia fortunei]